MHTRSGSQEFNPEIGFSTDLRRRKKDGSQLMWLNRLCLQKSPPVDSRVQPAISTSPTAIVQSQLASQSNSSALTSFASSPVFTPHPPVTSPTPGVTRTMPGYPTDSIPPLPSALERTIKIKKGTDQLGEKPLGLS